MSDRESSLTPERNGSRVSSRGKSVSPVVRKRSKSTQKRSASKSRSRSRSPKRRKRRSYSRSKSRSRSRSMSRRRRRSGFRSHSNSGSPRRRRITRSRSRSRSYDRYRDDRRSRRHSHSRSPMSNRRRHVGSRENPQPNRCVGVFGLSLYTTEREIRDVFTKYGHIEDCHVVYDAQTGRSRGFAFVYFATSDQARDAKETCAGMEIDGRRIRVDYSITHRAHTPTPGIYMGKPTHRDRSPVSHRRSTSPVYRGRSRSYSRSPRNHRW